MKIKQINIIWAKQKKKQKKEFALKKKKVILNIMTWTGKTNPASQEFGLTLQLLYLCKIQTDTMFIQQHSRMH